MFSLAFWHGPDGVRARPGELDPDWTSNEAERSLAHTVATFQDGRRFEERGDATPATTLRKVAPHFRCVVLPRTKAKVLCDTIGVDLVAVEALSDSA
jgi:hypothetical protein